MIIEVPILKRGEVLVSLPRAVGNVPTQNYDRDAIQAVDQSGHLPLHVNDTSDGSKRRWILGREAVGDVVLRFVATLREVSLEMPINLRADLRWDQEGLMGHGLAFIPTRPDGKKVYCNTVMWDQSLTSDDTKAVWDIWSRTSRDRGN